MREIEDDKELESPEIDFANDMYEGSDELEIDDDWLDSVRFDSNHKVFEWCQSANIDTKLTVAIMMKSSLPLN